VIELPIACSLNPAELAERRAAWAALADVALARHVPLDGGVRLVFDAGPAVETRVRELVTLERDCCGFMRFEVRASVDAVVLDVSAPDAMGIAAVKELLAAR
jgi:hypothetical protein